jgi:hypothetical protein
VVWLCTIRRASRVSRTNKIRAFWRKLGNSIAASAPAMAAVPSTEVERTRRAIDRDGVIQIPQSLAESLVSAARARRGDFLHLSRGALTFAAQFQSESR